MAAFTAFLIFLFIGAVSAADQHASSFSFTRFDRDPYFESTLSLLGDSKVVNGGSAIQLAGTGEAVYKKPIKIVRGNSASFSTYFSFSMLRGSGNGFAFVMAPIRANSSDSALDGVLAVEFDSTKGVRLGKLSNVSSLKLNSVQMLQSWIDYEAGSRRLEIRLAKIKESRPQYPILFHQIDLWKDSDLVIGLRASNQTCLIHSWSFKLRTIPQWMHSQPLNPNLLVSKDLKNSSSEIRVKSDCFMKVLAAMIFGTASGALGSFILLYLWAMFGSRRPVAPEELVAKPMEYDHKKFEVVVVDKAMKDGE